LVISESGNGFINKRGRILGDILDAVAKSLTLFETRIE
jgi:hypothetical protein